MSNTPQDEDLGSIADDDQIPESEEDVRQDPTPVNPEVEEDD